MAKTKAVPARDGVREMIQEIEGMTGGMALQVVRGLSPAALDRLARAVHRVRPLPPASRDPGFRLVEMPPREPTLEEKLATWRGLLSMAKGRARPGR